MNVSGTFRLPQRVSQVKAAFGSRPIDIAILLYGVFFALRSIAMPQNILPASFTVLRFGVYLLAPLVFLVALRSSRVPKLRPEVLIAFVLFTLSMLISLLFGDALRPEIGEFYLLITPLICTVIVYEIDDRAIKQLSKVLIGLFVISVFAAMRGGDVDMDVLDSSGMPTESTYAFPLAVVTLYFVLTKQWRWTALMSVVTFLAFKRSTLLGLMLGYGFYFILTTLRIRLNSAAACVVSFGVFMGGAALSVSIVAIFESFHYEGSINAVTEGRYLINQILLGVMSHDGLKQMLVGHGWGFTKSTLFQFAGLAQPHNDYLKAILDQGWVGLIFICTGLTVLLRAGMFTIPLSCLMATVFMFDNTLIYIHSFFVFVVVAVALRAELSAQMAAKRVAGQMVGL